MSVATARLIADQQHVSAKTDSSIDNPSLKYFTVDRMFELYREKTSNSM